MRGSKANLEIVQGAFENYVPTLYVNPTDSFDEYALSDAIEALSKTYAGITLEKLDSRWRIHIPESLREGHEAHFAQVTRRFIQFYKDQKIPDWEITNMLSKYYLTTNALKLAQSNAAKK